MSDNDPTRVTSLSRRGLLRHTGAAAIVGSGITTSTAQGAKGKNGPRLIETAIVYEKMSDTPNDTELQTINYPPPMGYSVEGNEVRINKSLESGRVGDLLKQNSTVINFGGLRPLTSESIPRRRPRSLVYKAYKHTQASMGWEVSNDSSYRTPYLSIKPTDNESIIEVQDSRLSIPIGASQDYKLDTVDVQMKGLKFTEGKFDNPDIPDQELAQKHEIVALSITMQPRLRVKDHGIVEIRE